MTSFVDDRCHPTRRDSSPGCDTRAITHARTLTDTAARIARELRDALRSDREQALALLACRLVGDDIDRLAPTSMLSLGTCKVGSDVPHHTR